MCTHFVLWQNVVIRLNILKNVFVVLIPSLNYKEYFIPAVKVVTEMRGLFPKVPSTCIQLLVNTIEHGLLMTHT